MSGVYDCLLEVSCWASMLAWKVLDSVRGFDRWSEQAWRVSLALSSGTLTIFVWVKGYPENNPKVIVKKKVIWRNRQLECHLSIVDSVY